MRHPTDRLGSFLSTREVASRLGVSSKTIGRWVQRGELRAHHLGRQIRVSEEDICAFLAARRR